MILAIFVLASFLLVPAVLALVAAINLVPTDFGFTYAQVSSVLFGAGIITLAIGLAARALNRQLKRMAKALEDNLSVAQTAPDLSPDVVPASLPEAVPAQGAEQKEAGHGAIGTIAAVGAAGAAAGALAVGAQALAGQAETSPAAPSMTHDPVPPAVADRIMEELESDLFAQMPPPAEEASAGETPTDEASHAGHPESEPASAADAPAAESAVQEVASGAPEAALTAVEQALAAVEPPREETFTLSPDFTLPLNLPEVPILTLEPAAPGEPATAALPEAAPAEAVAEPAPAPQPGLIADADLAALAEDRLPPLAPLSTLEVVGAYDSAGTRFTMYSDGSVTAAGPDGETRFRTLDDLRRHLGTHQG